ncbi:hypothetical protein QBC35DRAFT_477292 [Podospora australis]|uniref:Uncharacterized protein n=1 Tax=Podospora australis TaxID=1536484 RepID=A0AAN6WMK9_9PEZI|nr:hypothetical protein QBC35DRAFT_477292 [Podospora australis]
MSDNSSSPPVPREGEGNGKQGSEPDVDAVPVLHQPEITFSRLQEIWTTAPAALEEAMAQNEVIKSSLYSILDHFSVNNMRAIVFSPFTVLKIFASKINGLIELIEGIEGCMETDLYTPDHHTSVPPDPTSGANDQNSNSAVDEYLTVIKNVARLDLPDGANLKHAWELLVSLRHHMYTRLEETDCSAATFRLNVLRAVDDFCAILLVHRRQANQEWAWRDQLQDLDDEMAHISMHDASHVLLVDWFPNLRITLNTLRRGYEPWLP